MLLMCMHMTSAKTMTIFRCIIISTECFHKKKKKDLSQVNCLEVFLLPFARQMHLCTMYHCTSVQGTISRSLLSFYFLFCALQTTAIQIPTKCILFVLHTSTVFYGIRLCAGTVGAPTSYLVPIHQKHHFVWLKWTIWRSDRHIGRTAFRSPSHAMPMPMFEENFIFHDQLWIIHRIWNIHKHTQK